MTGVRVGLVRSGKLAGVGSRLMTNGEVLGDCAVTASRPNGEDWESEVRIGLNDMGCVMVGAARSTGKSSSSSSGFGDELLRVGEPVRARSRSPDPDRGKAARWTVGESSPASSSLDSYEIGCSPRSSSSSWSAKSDNLIPPRSSAIPDVSSVQAQKYTSCKFILLCRVLHASRYIQSKHVRMLFFYFCVVFHGNSHVLLVTLRMPTF
jgi:hypothetical protein